MCRLPTNPVVPKRLENALSNSHGRTTVSMPNLFSSILDQRQSENSHERPSSIERFVQFTEIITLYTLSETIFQRRTVTNSSDGSSERSAKCHRRWRSVANARFRALVVECRRRIANGGSGERGKLVSIGEVRTFSSCCRETSNVRIHRPTKSMRKNLRPCQILWQQPSLQQRRPTRTAPWRILIYPHFICSIRNSFRI